MFSHNYRDVWEQAGFMRIRVLYFHPIGLYELALIISDKRWYCYRLLCLETCAFRMHLERSGFHPVISMNGSNSRMSMYKFNSRMLMAISTFQMLRTCSNCMLSIELWCCNCLYQVCIWIHSFSVSTGRHRGGKISLFASYSN